MNNPDARKLALRDPALMAVLGMTALSMGAQSDFGAEFGDEWGCDTEYGADFGSDYGADWGYEFGADAPGAVVVAPSTPIPTKAQAIQMARSAAQRQSITNRRGMILEPNKGSSIKVEKYTFPISQAITLGTGVTLNPTGQPDTTIRPQRVTMNAPSPMFAFLTELKVANVSVTIGGGVEDCYNYNPLGVGQALDMPTLSPANRATMLGTYTGFVPPGFVGGTSSFFSVTFKGPSTIVA